MPIQSHTKPEPWSVQQLVDALSDKPQRKVRLELPKFQRSIVWNTEQQRALIHSLHEGFPIGSLLFYERHAGADGLKTYLLVDGLQRTISIRSYMEQPLAFLAVESLDQKAVANWVLALRNATSMADLEREQAERWLADWMRVTRTLQATDGFSGWTLVGHVATSIGRQRGDLQSDELEDASNRLIDSIHAKISLSEVSLSVLVYEGDEARLPDIFERINHGGTTLTKYEIFAATWVNQETNILNEDIREAVFKKYEDLLDSGMQIEGVRDDGSIENYSLFEYLFGLGKYLTKTFPLLFASKATEEQPEAIGFTLATISHGLRLSEMRRLPECFKRDGRTGLISPDEFEKALIESANFVKEVLEPFIGIKLNRQSGDAVTAHSEYQIASTVTRALAGRYDTKTWQDREGWEEDRQVLRRTLPQHYLLDVIAQNWRGTGDARLYERTWRTDLEGDDDTPGSHYRKVIARDEWDRALDSWFDDQLRKTQRTRGSVRSVEKAFLAFIYSGILNYREHLQDTFEIEHVLPVSRLTGLIEDDDDGWPISAIGNLALFERGLNREVSKQTIKQYLDRFQNGERQTKEQEIKKYLLCDVDEVDIPRQDGADVLTREDYEAIVRARYMKMKEALLTALRVEGTN